MTPSAISDSPSIDHDHDNTNNNLQPFFVLHKPFPKKSAKARRKIDLSVESPSSAQNSDRAEKNLDDHHYEQLRAEAFHLVWSKIEFNIKQVLRDINTNVFNEIHQWVCESFVAIQSSSGTFTSSEIYRSRPLITDISCRKIFAALVFTKNVEFVDDLLTFKELNLHLKSRGCHVVNLSSLNFSAKNGIGGCITSLLRQLVMVEPDVADIAILASWYSEPENYGSPLVVIIDDMERCNGSVLSDFILILSEWIFKLPVILVMGVATTVDAPRILLSANALNRLQPCKFTLGSSAERLHSILEAITFSTNSGFDIGYKVVMFLKNYFSKHDGTVTSFIRALKIACAKHFTMEPLSFLCKGLLDEDYQDSLNVNCVSLPESMLECAFNLPSCKSGEKTTPVTGKALASGLSDMMKLKKKWCSAFLCLYEASKFKNMQLLDVLCAALDPALYSSMASPKHQLGKDFAKVSSIDHWNVNKGSLILQIIRKVRDLPVKPLHQLLHTWKKHSEAIPEIHEKVTELQSMLVLEDESNTSLQPDLTGLSKRQASRSCMNTQRGKVNQKAALLMECMVSDYLKPIESAPFHEIFCFKHVDILQSALIGDPRRMIQVDLLKSHKCLANSMHDTSILYTLAQEHGDLINLHDWFQSFKSTTRLPKAKSKLHSPSPKKRKQANESEDTSDALVQARFCRAVIELQITGLLRMPNKRCPDFVQRVAFGL